MVFAHWSVLIKGMRAWWCQPNKMKMVTKSQTRKFETLIESVEERLMRAREERAGTEARLEERKSFVDLVATIVRKEVRKAGVSERGAPAINYADVVRRNDVPKVSGVKGPVLPVPKRIVIRHENKEIEEVEKKLKELVRPSDIGLKVKRLTRIRNGVILEA